MRGKKPAASPDMLEIGSIYIRIGIKTSRKRPTGTILRCEAIQGITSR
jgi:hypothetical protein